MVKKDYLRQYLELFCHPRNRHAIQKPDGSYFLVREPITADLVHRHLKGELTCGWYALDPDHTARWVVLDADQDNGLVLLQQAWQQLHQLNLTAYLEASRRGGHLWLLVEPTQAAVLRTLMIKMLQRLSINDVEIYPRQDKLAANGVGSLIRGPLGVHQLTGERYYFVDPIHLTPVGSTLTDQLEYVLTFKVNSVHQIAQALAELIKDLESSAASSERFALRNLPGDGRNTVEQVKAAIGDLYVFISCYVDLDANGRGSCPFHPPDRHPSFAVNREKGYWVCFHETNPQTGRYLGGDAIEFYRRLKGLSFQETLAELGQKYGVHD